MNNTNNPEFVSIAAFAVYLRDDERMTYTVEELHKLNAITRLPQHEIKHALSEQGFSLERRQAPMRVRGFTTSSNDRWYGPGSDKTHGGTGF